jgi:poly-gamma-glutamate synthesis protein (capsule biosynthesis protein)
VIAARALVLLVAGALLGCATERRPPVVEPVDRPAAGAPLPSAPAPEGVDGGALPAATAEPPKEDSEGTLRFLAVGDVLLSRGVARAIAEAGDPEVIYRGMDPVLSRVDFTLANLECPLAATTVNRVRGNVFNAPQAWVTHLAARRFLALGLANNHILDQGEQGLYDTLEVLRAAGLSPFGVGRNQLEAWRAAVIDRRGVRVAFVGASYAALNDGSDTWLPFVARIGDTGRLRAAIAEARERADFVVAAMHAGIEYVPVSFGPQHLFARAAIDAGADLVIGSHPHVVQPVERHRDRYIFYSLGNFIFDQSDRHTDEGAALEVTLRRRDEGVALERIEVLPVIIENGAPRLLEGERAAGVLARMKLEDRVLR